jgi:prefoldin subunit 5
MDALETADRTQPTEVAAKTERLREKIDKLREQMRNLDRTAESLQSVNLITIQDLKEAG